MITVGMNYHVIEGKQQDFEDKFAGVIDALKAAEGHTSSTLWKDVSDKRLVPHHQRMVRRGSFYDLHSQRCLSCSH